MRKEKNRSLTIALSIKKGYIVLFLKNKRKIFKPIGKEMPNIPKQSKTLEYMICISVKKIRSEK